MLEIRFFFVIWLELDLARIWDWDREKKKRGYF